MGSSNPQSSTKYEPPAWTEGRYPAAMGMVDELANREYQQFQGQRVAAMNPWQHTAGQLTVDKAVNSDPQTRAARGSMMSISQGKAANPYLDDVYLNATIRDNANDMGTAHAEGTAAFNDSAAALGGAYGGTLHAKKQSMDAGELAKRVGQMGNAARSQDLGRKTNAWNSDVQNVMQAAAQAPTFSNLDTANYDSLMKYGGQQQNYSQSILTDRFNEWQRQRDYPMQQADWLLSALQRASGQYGSNYSTGPGQSPWGTAAGLGMTAYGMSNGFGM